MNINREIEFKCLLDPMQFLKIKEDYFKNVDCYEQTNEYFIDKMGSLRKHLYSLRIRHLDGQIEFTLKKPDGFSKIEINENLTVPMYKDLINCQPIKSSILEELKKINIDVSDLTILTSLTTKRYEINYMGGLLCLDESHYEGLVDYEIEYEAQSEKEGREIFTRLLSNYQIFYQRNCLGKMTRAINAKTI